MFFLQSVQPDFLLGAKQVWLSLLGQRQKGCGMGRAGRCLFSLCLQVFQSKLAQHRQQPKARLPVAPGLLVQQALI